MPSKLESRLAVLERRQHHGGPMVVVIRGGLTDGDPSHAQAGELRLESADGESFQSFGARAVAEATAASKPFVVIGGLHIE
jgi:hypothetical protein